MSSYNTWRRTRIDELRDAPGPPALKLERKLLAAFKGLPKDERALEDAYRAKADQWKATPPPGTRKAKEAEDDERRRAEKRSRDRHDHDDASSSAAGGGGPRGAGATTRRVRRRGGADAAGADELPQGATRARDLKEDYRSMPGPVAAGTHPKDEGRLVRDGGDP